MITQKNAALAIDIGATKVAIGLIGIDGKVITRQDVSSKADNQAELNSRVAVAIKAQLSNNDFYIKSVGIGSAGPINPATGIINPVNISLWENFALVDFIADASGISEVVLIGDASALTYAEFKLGAGKGANNLLGVVVSTGIGGGLVLEGKFFPGNSGNAGYFGHTIIEMNGDECSCGFNGCVEAYASGPNMLKYAIKNGVSLKDADSFAELAELARNKDLIALETINRGARALATGLLNSVATLDLDRIVIGGGVLNASDIYLPVLKKYFYDDLKKLGFAENCEIMQTSLNQNSGLIGAGLASFNIDRKSLAV
jgi:glucokinase